MVSVHLRQKKGRYYADCHDPERRPARKWVPLATGDQKVAMQRLTQLERELAMGLKNPWTDKPQQPGIFLSEAIDKFMKSRKSRRASTQDNYRHVLGLFKRGLAPDLQLRHVEARHVESFLKGQKLNETSRGTYYRHLRVFFRWCFKEELLSQNPLDKFETPRSARTVAQFLTPEQVDHLIKYIDADIAKKGGYVQDGEVAWLKDVIRFAVYTGMRRGEICNLHWSAVDLDSGFLTVRNSEDFQTKTGHERPIPIAGEAREVLERLASARTEEGDGYVFVSPSGGKLVPEYVSKRFAYYRKKAKLPKGIRFHSLRHTCASWLVMRSVPLSVVQAMLGHSSIQVTQRYAHLAPKSFKDEIERAFNERNKVRERLAWAA